MKRPTVRLRPPPIAITIAALVLLSCSDSGSGPPKRTGPVTPVDLSTAGSIQVQVTYSGPVPAPKVINMNGTPACAALHPNPVFDQSLMVTDGRLADAVVYIRSGFAERLFAPPSEAVVIDQKGCLYDPHVTALMVGQPLQFRNSDQEAHNVHGRPKEVEAWNFLMSRPNSTRDVSFAKPEVGIPVSCDVHPWMRAYVSVLDNPYFAVTRTDGTVTLRPVPPGDYVVAVWHASLGTLVQPVSLAASGTASVQFAYRAPQDSG